MSGRWLRGYALVIYLFLYAPIGLIVLISFSSGRQASSFTGFSLQWYGTAFANRFMVEALGLRGALVKRRSYSQLGSSRKPLATMPICQGITV